jgi:hypothetical protein
VKEKELERSYSHTTVNGFQTGYSNNTLFIKSPLSMSLQSNHDFHQVIKTRNLTGGYSAIYTTRYFVKESQGAEEYPT